LGEVNGHWKEKNELVGKVTKERKGITAQLPGLFCFCFSNRPILFLRSCLHMPAIFFQRAAYNGAATASQTSPTRLSANIPELFMRHKINYFSNSLSPPAPVAGIEFAGQPV
jgi:hypothetical protein